MQGILRMDNRHLFFIENASTKNDTLILSAEPPFIVGQVWMFRTQEEFDRFVYRNNNPTKTVLIDDYRIAIVFKKSFEVMDSSKSSVMCYITLLEMREFYKQERLIPHAPKYLKYKK